MQRNEAIWPKDTSADQEAHATPASTAAATSSTPPSADFTQVLATFTKVLCLTNRHHQSFALIGLQDADESIFAKTRETGQPRAQSPNDTKAWLCDCPTDSSNNLDTSSFNPDNHIKLDTLAH